MRRCARGAERRLCAVSGESGATSATGAGAAVSRTRERAGGGAASLPRSASAPRPAAARWLVRGCAGSARTSLPGEASGSRRAQRSGFIYPRGQRAFPLLPVLRTPGVPGRIPPVPVTLVVLSTAVSSQSFTVALRLLLYRGLRAKCEPFPWAAGELPSTWVQAKRRAHCSARAAPSRRPATNPQPWFSEDTPEIQLPVFQAPCAHCSMASSPVGPYSYASFSVTLKGEKPRRQGN